MGKVEKPIPVPLEASQGFATFFISLNRLAKLVFTQAYASLELVMSPADGRPDAMTAIGDPNPPRPPWLVGSCSGPADSLMSLLGLCRLGYESPGMTGGCLVGATH